MVSRQKIIMLLCLMAINIRAPHEQFLEESTSKTRRTPLSQARREAVEGLEQLAHALITETERLGSLLHRVLDTTRDVIEGKSTSVFMERLKQQRQETLKLVHNTYTATQKRIQELETTEKMLTRQPLSTTCNIK
jgi:hypothetical protein